MYPNFHPCLASHHVDKFSEVTKFIHLNTQNCAPILEFLLSQKIFLGLPQLLDLTYKALPSSRHLEKFHGSRSAEACWRFSAAKCKKKLLTHLFHQPNPNNILYPGYLSRNRGDNNKKSYPHRTSSTLVIPE